MSTKTVNKKVVKKNGNIYTISVERYNSEEELARDCDKRAAREYEDMKYYSDYSEWHGVDSYDEALDLLKHGYQPTVDKMYKAIKFNKQGVGQKRIRFENNVHGFAPVVPLALKGIPNSMVNMTMKRIKCKVIDVYYDLDALAYVHSDEIIECGQKLLQIIIELEKQGYKFNLYAMQAYADCDDADILCVKIKSSDKPFDLKKMSFPLTHTAFLRVIGFDWQGKCPFTKYRGTGRGSNFKERVRLKDDRQKIIKEVCGENAVYIPMSSLKGKSYDYIKEALVK